MKKVEISWIDSKGATSSWEYVTEIDNLKPALITSVGYLFEDNDEYKTIIQSMCEDESPNKQQVLGRTSIPTVCIKSMREIG